MQICEMKIISSRGRKVGATKNPFLSGTKSGQGKKWYFGYEWWTSKYGASIT